MIFRQITHDDLGCASYLIGDEDAGDFDRFQAKFNLLIAGSSMLAEDEGPEDIAREVAGFAAAIRAAAGPEVRIVDSAETTARHVRAALRQSGLATVGGQGALRLLATDAPERFARIGARFLERPIAARDVELIDL